MKAIKFLVIVITLGVLFSTCSENDNVEPNQIPSDSVDLPLTDETAAFLETVKDTVIRLEDIILEDGQNVRSFLEENAPEFLQAYPSGRVGRTKALTPREQRKMYLSKMLAFGTFLADRSKHVYAAGGKDKPFQFGLAYSWGSKDYNVRQLPPTVEPNGCNDLKIHGLDCSGMIWAMTQSANLTVVPKYNFFVKYISNVQKWTNAFKESADYKDLKMKDMGRLGEDKMKNGDLILWNRHVGIYINGWFYQSNGGSEKPRCNGNLSLSSGPRIISLHEVLSWNELASYKVFRIFIDLEFKVEMRFVARDRVTGGLVGKAFQEWDSVSLKLEIKNDQVTCSNFFNSPGKVTPGSLTDDIGCTSTQIPPEGFKGPIDITSASGTFTEETQQLNLTFLGTSQAPAFEWKCPLAGTILFPVASGPFFFPALLKLNLGDSITTYLDPSDTFFFRFTPKR